MEPKKCAPAHVWIHKICFTQRMMTLFVFADRYDPNEACKHTRLVLVTARKIFLATQDYTKECRVCYTRSFILETKTSIRVLLEIVLMKTHVLVSSSIQNRVFEYISISDCQDRFFSSTTSIHDYHDRLSSTTSIHDCRDRFSSTHDCHDRVFFEYYEYL